MPSNTVAQRRVACGVCGSPSKPKELRASAVPYLVNGLIRDAPRVQNCSELASRNQAVTIGERGGHRRRRFYEWWGHDPIALWPIDQQMPTCLLRHLNTWPAEC